MSEGKIKHMKMIRILCQKCGSGVSNDFSENMSFCQNCCVINPPANESSILSAEENQASQITHSKKRSLVPILIVFLFILTIFGSAAFLVYLPICRSGFPSFTSSLNPCSSGVPVSEISEISLRNVRFYGLLHDRKNNKQIQSKIAFFNNGSAQKIESEITHDEEGKRKDKRSVYRAVLTGEQFERLAKVVVENDLFNETDSKERISESDNLFLKVIYSGGQREIQTSNLGKDTFAVAETLKAFRALENEVIWIKEY